GWQDLADFLLRLLYAVWSLGMRVKGLGQGAGLLFLQSLYLLKEGDECRRIISGAVHVFHTQVIRLGLKSARESEHEERSANPRGLVGSVADRPAHKDQRDAGDLHQVPARHLPRDVARRNVCDFMRH